MSQVIIGMDPHKRPATIEVMAGDETVLGGGRYGTESPPVFSLASSLATWTPLLPAGTPKTRRPAPGT